MCDCNYYFLVVFVVCSLRVDLHYWMLPGDLLVLQAAQRLPHDMSEVAAADHDGLMARSVG